MAGIKQGNRAFSPSACPGLPRRNFLEGENRHTSSSWRKRSSVPGIHLSLPSVKHNPTRTRKTASGIKGNPRKSEFLKLGTDTVTL